MDRKKLAALLMILIMPAVMFLYGCSSPDNSEPADQPDSSEAAQTEESETAEESEPADQAEDSDSAAAVIRYMPVKAEFYDYDPDNTEEFPSAEEIHCTYEYTYDEHGNLLKCHKQAEVSEMDDTYENTYRSDGTLEKVKAKIASDPYQDGEIEYNEHSFDCDENGKMINPDDPAAKAKNVSYTDDGLVTHNEYEDEEGNPGVWDYEYETNDQGLVTKVMKHYEHDEYYVYVFTYDTNNKNTEVTADRYADFINGIWNGLSAW